MITSDISRNRTAQLPFLETPSPIYIEKAVLERYFPRSVAAWMEDQRGTYDEHVEQRDDVFRLPHPQNIPVIFGARLSLSFPVLLSALPLLTPDFAKGAELSGHIPLRRLWFSDGGLTSNFPVHFFDSPVPSRPTFCLNLIDYDAGAPDPDADQRGMPEAGAREGIRDAKKSVTLARDPERSARNRIAPPAGDPQPNDPVWKLVSMSRGNRMSPAPFTAFDMGSGSGPIDFLQTLMNTARCWSDNQLLLAPGVRDRVVNILLRNDEGGLNLDMSAGAIAELDFRGRAAGLLISARFDPSASSDPATGEASAERFANHRWVRYRNFMTAFEDIARRFALSRRGSDAAATSRGESLLDPMIDGKATEKLGYPAPAAARPFYHASTDGLEQLALQMAAATRADPMATFDRPRAFDPDATSALAGSAPRPKMRLRLRPLVDNDPRAEQADLPKPEGGSKSAFRKSGFIFPVRTRDHSKTWSAFRFNRNG